MVAGLIINPLPIVTGSSFVIKHTIAVLFVLDPVTVVLIAIQILVNTVTVFLTV
jgi:hypothetical protein